MADYLIVLSHGKIQVDGKVEDLMSPRTHMDLKPS